MCKTIWQDRKSFQENTDNSTSGNIDIPTTNIQNTPPDLIMYTNVT